MFLLKPFYTFKKKFPLASYITNRLVTMTVTLFLLGLAVFALMALVPSNNVKMNMLQHMLDQQGRLGQKVYENRIDEQIKGQEAEQGLDKPFYAQYFLWLGRVARGDLGKSGLSRAPVSFLISSRLFNSLLLNVISLVLITVFSFALGVYFSSKAGTRTDLAVTFISLTLHAFPGLLLLILLQMFASVTGWFPTTAYPTHINFSAEPVKFTFSYLYHIFLPLLAIFLGGIGGTIRMIRATMLDQLGQPYITSLRSRGISEYRIYFHHAFRNTLNPYITGSANLLAGLFSGSLILEIIFAYPGIGNLMYDAVIKQDVNLVMVNIMFLSFLALAGMALADILLALVDPRIRYGKE
jgi:peptide/nickel transport system permease protein